METRKVKMKVRTETINLVFLLVSGAVTLFLGFITGSIWFIAPGLIFVFWGLSFTNKAYAKYIVPPVLICGATLLTLGLYFSHVGYRVGYGAYRLLFFATGFGMICGGIVYLILTREHT
jgi:hypothetical protein